VNDAASAALDRIALRDLVDAYALTADARDSTGFASLFTADAVLTVHDAGGRLQGTFTGVGEIAAIPAALARYPRTLHLVSTHRATPVGDTATGTTLCEAHHLSAGEDGTVDRVLVIRYDDAYVRTPGGWRFARRDVRVQWEEHRAVDAEATLP
jgi:hypothetical protein